VSGKFLKKNSAEMTDRSMIKILIGKSLAIAFILLFGWVPYANPPGATFADGKNENRFLSDLNECTTGLASGLATPDGRPLLWKNRDCGNSNQEFHYVDDGRIPFISITYRGEDDEYYGGINAAGFAVENSNSYNLSQGPYGSDDDGEIHMLALATCRTVDDFERMMDSTNITGRTLNSNYGTIDAFGGAAMFEVGGYSYTRIDAEETPDGFIVRSNYSYSGSGLNQRQGWWGPHRHDRAYYLWKAAVDNDQLTPRYLFQQVIRDLSIPGVDPYPLPFDGYVDNNHYGCIPNSEAICRSTTQGILVAQGVRDGERPEDAILWAMVGNQLATVPVPLWVRAGSVPVEMDGDPGSRICSRGIQIANWIYAENGVNTWKLTNPQNTGIWDYTFPLEDWIYDKVERFVNSPAYDWDRLAAFQNQIARQVADSLDAWRPTYDVTKIYEVQLEGNDVRLIWNRDDDRDQVFGDAVPRGYNIYRSDEPFREGEQGELIAFVAEASEYVDRAAPAVAAFYRVETVF